MNKQKKLITGLLVIIATGLIIATIWLIMNKPAAAPQSPDGQTPPISNTAKDGEVRFTLTDHECGLARVGDASAHSEAKGQYCTVSLSVTNDSDETITMTSLDQLAIDMDGKKYKGDAVALFYVGNDSWYTAIGAGDTAKGSFVFDVPKDGMIETFQFHAGTKTPGATISIPMDHENQ